MNDPKSPAKRPFFARFLEGQDFPRVKTDVKAGRPTRPEFDTAHTMKYPSDDDEPGGGEIS